MSLLDLASLVLAPTAVKDGKVYNAIPNDQDFTFSRGTEATRVNSAGLIEKARTNRLLQSNNFNTTWGTGFSTLTSGQVGYDGTNDAWKIESTTIGGETRIRQSQTFTTGEVISLSVYMKKGNVNFGIVRTYAITGGGRAWFDLENGTVETENSGINGSIKDVGNGWYRCSIWGVITTTGAVDIAPAPADGDYLADAVGEFIYIQDSQLESGLVATDVITTTTSSVTVGITDDLPRVDYSGGGCPSLLLEGSRTNLVTNSEYVNSSDYVTGNWSGTITTNTSEILSPEGLHNATKFVKSGSTDRVYFQTSVSDGTYTGSMYFKAVSGQEGNTIEISVRRFGGGSGATTKLITLSSEWQRVDVTATLSGGTNTAIYIADFSSSGNANSFYFYGLQLEQNASYVSSYIPTYGTSTSRSADSCSLTNASNLIGQSEGTVFLEASTLENGADCRITISDNTINNRVSIEWDANADTIKGFIGVGGNVETTSYNQTNQNKIALTYDATDARMYINGVKVDTDTSVPTLSGMNRIDFSNYGSALPFVGNVYQMYVSKEKLTDDQCIALTK